MTQAEFDVLPAGAKYAIRLPSCVVVTKVKAVPYTVETRQQFRAMERLIKKGHAAVARGPQ